jgi:hypothetical protein
MPAEMELVLDALRDSNISVAVRGSTMDFNPEPPETLKPLLLQEGARLLERHRQAAMALNRIVDERWGDARKWLKLRDRVGKHENYRDDVPAYRLLASWVAAHEMRARAYRKLDVRKRSTFDERGSWRADISFSDRLIDSLLGRLLAAALLNPELHRYIIRIK